MSLTKVSYSMITGTPVNVADYIPEGVNPATTSCTVYVQAAIDYCLANSKDLLIPYRIYLATQLKIDRAVNTTTSFFTIFGNSTESGFWTDQSISMIGSNIGPLSNGTPGSEGVRFQEIKFQSSLNTISNFVLDGKRFVRMQFIGCYFEKIRLLATQEFVQTFLISQCYVIGIRGVWMQAIPGGVSTVAGSLFDVHFTDNVFETSEASFSEVVNASGIYTGGDWKGNLVESWQGPAMTISGGCTGVSITGNYFESIPSGVFKLGTTYSVFIGGNFINDAYSGTTYAIDCQTSWSVTSAGNYCNGNLFKTSNMQTTTALTAAGFYKTVSKGLISLGDVAYTGNIYDVAPPALNFFNTLSSAIHKLGVNDGSVGNTTQKVAQFLTDGVSGVTPNGGVNVYTVPGTTATICLNFNIFDAATGEIASPAMSLSYSGISPIQGATGAITYKKGAIYFDTTLNKLRVGGATGWETITSV